MRTLIAFAIALCMGTVAALANDASVADNVKVDLNPVITCSGDGCGNEISQSPAEPKQYSCAEGCDHKDEKKFSEVKTAQMVGNICRAGFYYCVMYGVGVIGTPCCGCGFCGYWSNW